MAFAAFAFAACTDDDNIDPGVNEVPKGELVEAISINFGESKASTRAKAGTEKGEGTEGMIYEAFIFAKEANPSHTRAKTGDYTVIRVTADPATGALVAETGGVDEEATAKKDLTKAINEGSKSEVEWLVKNVATFHGVRQGDYVYVIANDPSLTLAQASEKAHQGEASEESIKGYVASINKDYLYGLVYRPENASGVNGAGDPVADLPSGKFFMAGREMIPVSPTIPSNGTFSLQIGLDRELAKVNFRASVSTSTEDAACGNVVFKEDDGIVVARIARKTSPFVNQESGDWYVPAMTNKENWPINNHALVNGIYSSSCDGTMEGARVFDGTSATPITNWVTNTTIPAKFNAVAPAADVTEYRYSWKVDGTDANSIKDPKNHVYLKSGTLFGPMFYTTPNYSNNTNSVTVICTQATYVGRGIFSLSDMADKYVDAALAAGDSVTIYTKEELAALEKAGKTIDTSYKDAAGKVVHGLSVPNPLVYRANSDGDDWLTDNITAKLKNVIDSLGVALIAKEDYPTTAPTSGILAGMEYDAYDKMMNRFYLAVLLQQRLENKNTPVVGTKETGASTISAYGNGIEKDKEVFLANKELAVTDSLMMGVVKLENKRIAIPFYIDLSADRIASMKAVAKTLNLSGAGEQLIMNGRTSRDYFFVKTDAYEYFKGQKVYYRADVADYVGGVSNKLTERNTYYDTSGTIKSLGAKSIHDAIYADNNAMSVDVTVNDWSLSINTVDM